MYGLYIAVVAIFCTFMAISVIGSVMKMSPRRPSRPDAQLAATECLAQAEVLWRNLDDERKGFTRSQPARNVDEAFTRFRTDWLRRFRELEGRCHEHTRKGPMQEVFRRLEQVQDLYTTHSVQYAGEVGPAVDELLSSINAARSEVKR